MKTMIKNNNFNNLSKIAFLMNIPLVLLYLPICFIYSDTQGVLLQGIDFILCVVLFAFYFVTLLFISNNKKIIVSNLLIQTVLLYELRGELPFALLWQHIETVSLWQGVIIYYIVLCALVTILEVVYSALQKVNKFQKV